MHIHVHCTCTCMHACTLYVQNNIHIIILYSQKIWWGQIQCFGGSLRQINNLCMAHLYNTCMFMCTHERTVHVYTCTMYMYIKAYGSCMIDYGAVLQEGRPSSINEGVLCVPQETAIIQLISSGKRARQSYRFSAKLYRAYGSFAFPVPRTQGS